MPTSHATITKLPAVSGSSGRLVIEQIADPTQERPWPGQVFVDERRDVRQRRQLEDAAWQALQGVRKTQATGAAKPAAPERQAQDTQWRSLRDQRRAAVVRRKEVAQAWQQKRLALRQQWTELPIVTAWLAILVITDNCSRQCLSLPLSLYAATKSVGWAVAWGCQRFSSS